MNPRQLPDAARTPVLPTKLAHVVLRVTDLPRSRAWYMAALQARPTFENDMMCMLTYDDEHHRVGLLARPDMGAQGDAQAGMEHVAFTFGSLPELLANYRRLARQGIEPFWCINHGPTVSMYYKDPDGIRLEFQHDVFASEKDVAAFFDSGAYLENFMGIKFDPEDMIARYEAGEPIESITARPRLPAGMSPWDMLVV